jgi:hypothetical protein
MTQAPATLRAATFDVRAAISHWPVLATMRIQ